MHAAVMFIAVTVVSVTPLKIQWNLRAPDPDATYTSSD